MILKLIIYLYIIILIKLVLCFDLSTDSFISEPDRNSIRSLETINGKLIYTLFTEKENYYDVCII
jgi:hypothetical protein